MFLFLFSSNVLLDLTFFYLVVVADLKMLSECETIYESKYIRLSIQVYFLLYPPKQRITYCSETSCYISVVLCLLRQNKYQLFTRNNLHNSYYYYNNKTLNKQHRTNHIIKINIVCLLGSGQQCLQSDAKPQKYQRAASLLRD